MKKYLIIIFSIVILLSGCDGPSKEYLQKQEIREQSKKVMDKFCYLNTLEQDKDWAIANIYFGTSKTDLSIKDKQVIKRVAIIHKKCTKPILIVSHASNLEATDIVKTMDITYIRGENVMNELQKNKVNNVYLKPMFCGNSSNLVKEDDDITASYNQRVEIIFLNTRADMHKYDCLIPRISDKVINEDS